MQLQLRMGVTELSEITPKLSHYRDFRWNVLSVQAGFRHNLIKLQLSASQSTGASPNSIILVMHILKSKNKIIAF
jgi:hypothetical protein